MSNIDEVIADLESKSVIVKGSATAQEVKDLVNGLGYEYIG